MRGLIAALGAVVFIALVPTVLLLVTLLGRTLHYPL